ncbi:MAG: hypothetical protein LBJ69_00435 [Holosporales bacterium]|nr:hypothetical protein [Holosporales bacterium]
MKILLVAIAMSTVCYGSGGKPIANPATRENPHKLIVGKWMGLYNTAVVQLSGEPGVPIDIGELSGAPDTEILVPVESQFKDASKDKLRKAVNALYEIGSSQTEWYMISPPYQQMAQRLTNAARTLYNLVREEQRKLELSQTHRRQPSQAEQPQDKPGKDQTPLNETPHSPAVEGQPPPAEQPQDRPGEAQTPPAAQPQDRPGEAQPSPAEQPQDKPGEKQPRPTSSRPPAPKPDDAPAPERRPLPTLDELIQRRKPDAAPAPEYRPIPTLDELIQRRAGIILYEIDKMPGGQRARELRSVARALLKDIRTADITGELVDCVVSTLEDYRTVWEYEPVHLSESDRADFIKALHGQMERIRNRLPYTPAPGIVTDHEVHQQEAVALLRKIGLAHFTLHQMSDAVEIIGHELMRILEDLVQRRAGIILYDLARTPEDQQARELRSRAQTLLAESRTANLTDELVDGVVSTLEDYRIVWKQNPVHLSESDRANFIKALHGQMERIRNRLRQSTTPGGATDHEVHQQEAVALLRKIGLAHFTLHQMSDAVEIARHELAPPTANP